MGRRKGSKNKPKTGAVSSTSKAKLKKGITDLKDLNRTFTPKEILEMSPEDEKLILQARK